MKLLKLMKDDSGATAVEYGLLAAIISVALLTGLGAYSNALNNQFANLAAIINY